MAKRRQEVGFIPAVARMTLASLVWPEGVLAVAVGGFGGYLAGRLTVEVRHDIAGDMLVVLAPLLGVVLAALTIVVAMMSDDYVRVLAKARDGVMTFYRPFIIAIGFQIIGILAVLAYRGAALSVDPTLETASFFAVAVLVTFVLLDILAIARTVLMHAVQRAKLLEGSD